MTFFTITLNLTLSYSSRSVLKYRIKSGGRLSGSKYFGRKLFSSPSNFPRRYKAAPTSLAFSRRHAATVTLQCKTKFDVQSALLVMHSLIFFSKFH